MLKIKEISKIALEWATLLAGIIFCFYMFALSESDAKLLFIIAGIVASAFTVYSLVSYKSKTEKANEDAVKTAETLLDQYLAEDVEKIKNGRSRNIYKHCQTLQEILTYYKPDPKYFGLKGTLIIPPVKNIQNKLMKQLIAVFGKEKINGPIVIVSDDEKIRSIDIHYAKYLFTITADKISIKKAEKPNEEITKKDFLKSLS